uniref:Ribosomal protein L6 n=1 Tax=Babesia orientalis TaxID=273649 RepID=A0A0M3TGT8_9APIC|nr:ribosomal protein L6 [Babesia orientalis]ALE29369.1 ribosomal protein L6 [Babesia orientalis]
MIKYFKNYTNKYFNYVNYTYTVDKYTRHTYLSSIESKTKHIKNVLVLNNIIFKTIFSKPLFFYNSLSKFIMFVKSFISKFYSMLESFFSLHTINIQILSIFYKIAILKDKLIIKINNFINIIIYISNIDQLKINIQYSNPIIVSISSYNKNFVTSLSNIIVNCKKFNVYTNTGIKYLNSNIRLKKILKLRRK